MVESSFRELKDLMDANQHKYGKRPWKIGRFIEFIKQHNERKIKEFVFDIARTQNSRKQALPSIQQVKKKKTYFTPSSLLGIGKNLNLFFTFAPSKR